MTDFIRMNADKTTSLIRQGDPLSLTGTGTTRLYFINERGGAVFYLYVHSIVSGSTTFTLNAGIGEYSTAVQSLGSISSPSTELTLVKIPICPSQGFVEIAHADSCTVSVWGQAVEATAETAASETSGISADAKVRELSLAAGIWTQVDTLAGVKQINIQNKSGSTVKVNWISPTQPVLPGSFLGPSIVNNQERFYTLDSTKSVTLWARCESAVTVTVEELK